MSNEHQHGHSHSHSHSHSHEEHHHGHNPEQDQLRPSHDGSVMIDIGGDMGALVITTGQDQLLTEIEISAVEPESPRVHVAVRERFGRGQPTRYAAVFPSLAAGEYTVWRHKGHDEPAATVIINGGQISELEWP